MSLFDSLRVLLDKIQKDRLASVGGHESDPSADTAAAGARASQGVKTFYSYLAQTIEEEPNPVVASFALNFYGIGASQEASANYGVQDPSYEVAKLEALSKDLQKRFPSSSSVAAIAQAVQLTINVPRVGAIAPDLSLPAIQAVRSLVLVACGANSCSWISGPVGASPVVRRTPMWSGHTRSSKTRILPW